MKLKTIFFCFTVSTLLTAAAGMYFYYDSQIAKACNEDLLVSISHATSIRQSFREMIQRYKAINLSLARHPELAVTSAPPAPEELKRANQLLDIYNSSLGTSACYLMDTRGLTIASSNRNDRDSFVGQNYAFRPYFTSPVQGKPFVYMAKGVTSGKRGI